MRIPLPANHLLREILGALAGTGVAFLLYLGFQQYSLATIRGSLIDAETTMSDAVTDATASIEAESAERIAEREKLTNERLAALDIRHGSSATDESEAMSASAAPPSEAPIAPGNLTTVVSDRERLALRAERVTSANDAGNQDESSSIDSTITDARQLAGVPVLPSETVSDTFVAIDEPQPVMPINRPLPESGPAEYGMILLALVAATAVIVRRRNAISAAR